MRTFLLTLILPIGLHAQGPTLEWGPQRTVASGSTDLLRPRIVLNGSGLSAVLWGSLSPRTNWVSVDDGDSFGPAVRIHPAGMQPVVDDWQGTGLAIRGDTVFAALKALPASTGATYLVTSLDGGHTWGDTLRVASGLAPQTRFSSVAIAPDGQPLVLYMAFEPGDVDPRWVVARMADGAFLPAVPASANAAPGEVCDCCTGELVAREEDVVALFRNNDDNRRTIWAALSTDGGETFTAGTEPDATGWTLNACPASGPDGLIVGDSLFTVWMSAATQGAKVYLRGTHLQTLQHGPNHQPHPVQETSLLQNHPRIAGHGDTLGVVWHQSSSGQQEVLFSWSTTGAGGFGPPDTVNVVLAGIQKSPDVVFAHGTFHIVWSDVTANTIQYRSATIPGASGIPSMLGPTPLALHPVPATDRLYVPHPGTGLQWRVIDALGRLRMEGPAQPVMDVSGLSQGTYLLHLHHPERGVVAGGRFIVAR